MSVALTQNNLYHPYASRDDKIACIFKGIAGVTTAIALSQISQIPVFVPVAIGLVSGSYLRGEIELLNNCYTIIDSFLPRGEMPETLDNILFYSGTVGLIASSSLNVLGLISTQKAIEFTCISGLSLVSGIKRN